MGGLENWMCIVPKVDSIASELITTLGVFRYKNKLISKNFNKFLFRIAPYMCLFVFFLP